MVCEFESYYQIESTDFNCIQLADRAKQIKCNAIINEDPKDKIILSLQEEINRLKSMMKGDTSISIGELSQIGKPNIKENIK